VDLGDQSWLFQQQRENVDLLERRLREFPHALCQHLEYQNGIFTGWSNSIKEGLRRPGSKELIEAVVASFDDAKVELILGFRPRIHRNADRLRPR